MFYLREHVHNSQVEYQSYINHLVKKYVGMIYYGCCGINEMHQNLVKNIDLNLIKEFSFKFGMLLYLKEELAYLKNRTYEYYVRYLIYNFSLNWMILETLFSFFLNLWSRIWNYLKKQFIILLRIKLIFININTSHWISALIC